MTVVIAAILTVEGGVARIDKGAIDGLGPGDRGRIFYSLKVAGRATAIDVGVGRVATVEDFAARLDPVSEAPIRPGYAVEIEIPCDRLAPDRMLAQAGAREASGDLETALAYLERLHASLPGDALVEARIADVRTGQDRRAREESERTNVPYYRVAAAELLARSDLDQARLYIDKLLTLLPGDPEATRMWAEIERRRRTRGMVRIPAAEYSIGVDLAAAEFYNQTPRFQVDLEAFWIDRDPVSRDAYRTQSSTPPGSPPGSSASSAGSPARIARSPIDAPSRVAAAERTATAVTHAEAATYCRSVGKRLPTELEWEAAATTLGLDGPAGLDEWTDSWYQPYPGNARPEKEYGEHMRVIRRLSDGGDAILRSRRFMAPGDRHDRVGFRCVRTAEEIAR